MVLEIALGAMLAAFLLGTRLGQGLLMLCSLGFAALIIWLFWGPLRQTAIGLLIIVLIYGGFLLAIKGLAKLLNPLFAQPFGTKGNNLAASAPGKAIRHESEYFDMRVRALGFLVAGTLAVLGSGAVFAQQTEQPPLPPWAWYGPGHMMWGVGWGFWWMMPLMMLFFFFTCGLLMWLLFGRMWRGGAHHWGAPWHMMGGGPAGSWRDPTHSALQILNERYAKGEIDKAEYEERKAAILTSREH